MILNLLICSDGMNLKFTFKSAPKKIAPNLLFQNHYSLFLP